MFAYSVTILEEGNSLEIYPTISKNALNVPIIAFDKLDGSNIRAEWTRKTGFTKFGTRRRLLDASEPILGEAVSIFLEKYADDLDTIFRKQRFEKTTAYFEFAGENSFAGYHEEEPHDVTLFDLHVYKQGIMTAKDFVKLFRDKVEIPRIIHEGKVNSVFIDGIRHSRIDGVTFEGVVCKGQLDNRNRPIMFKLKSKAWLEKLKLKTGDDVALFEKLA